jgi:hypothetical protein
VLVCEATMQQKLILKSSLAQRTATRFTFGIPNVDALFPGFKPGDFAVVYGPQQITPIISNLCVRAQMPTELGGLESNVVFIDAANSSSLSTIIQAAENQHINIKEALQKLTNIRAYTAYKLTSVIMEKLEEAITLSDAKLVVISDIVGTFLNDNVDDQEAKTVYSQILSTLSNIAKKHQIIIVATILPHESNRRNSIMQEITNAKAGIVARFTRTPYTSEFELEKHPSYMLGVADLTENNPLTELASTNDGYTGLIWH